MCIAMPNPYTPKPQRGEMYISSVSSELPDTYNVC